MGYYKRFIAKLLALEKSPHQLIKCCCVGIFVGASPFLGIQTWIAIPLSWLFGCNMLVVLAVLYLVNNPLTMFPIVVADYAVGYWIIEKWMGVHLTAYNPAWMSWVNQKIGPVLYKYLGVTEVCLWCYLIGGLLFATLCTLILYPFVRWCCMRRTKNN